ncbi:MAG TPA: LacI family DNA-binding transcriptional regulator [Symbiobacteriaceae bacterium]|jgi:LacI family transcriptional regulator
MPANIKDVARLAGVSSATVSRVLNGSAGVRTDTRDRVMAVVRQLNFAPSAVAKGLREGRSGIAGVCVPDISSLFFMDVVKGLENTLALSDYRLVVCDSQNQAKKERENCRWFLSGGVDALILIGPMMEQSALAELADMGTPIGIFGRRMDHPNVTSVAVENRVTAYRATEHLINHGHRKIAFITGIPGVTDGDEREAGYREALAQYGLPFQPDWVQVGNFTEEGGIRAFDTLLALPDRPTAVFTANDEMAIGVLTEARRCGLSVPEDIAVVGFDNIRLARLVAPALTSVNQPRMDAGFRLAQNLVQRMNGSADPERIVLEADLVIRQSCGCKWST